MEAIQGVSAKGEQEKPGRIISSGWRTDRVWPESVKSAADPPVTARSDGTQQSALIVTGAVKVLKGSFLPV